MPSRVSYVSGVPNGVIKKYRQTQTRERKIGRCSVEAENPLTAILSGAMRG